MRRALPALLAALLAAPLLAAQAAVPVYSGINDLQLQSETLFTGLAFPVALQFAADGRIFWAEWQGVPRAANTACVRVIEHGVKVPQPFACFRIRGNDGESGLTEVSLHPEFTRGKPWVYVFYTYTGPNGERLNNLSRVREVAHNRGGAEEVLIAAIPGGVIHNSGIIAWGPDGRLYLSVGDATRVADSQVPAGKLTGRILRLDEHGKPAPGNPIQEGDGTWAYGLRNTFGLAWHPNGKLYGSENGPTRNDEFNLLQPGGNYGWPLATGPCVPEGVGVTRVAERATWCATQAETPLWFYYFTIGPTNVAYCACPALAPQFRGQLYMGDVNNAYIHMFVLAPTGDGVAAHNVVWQDTQGVIDLLEGPDGNLWYTTGGDANGATGAIKRLRDFPFT